MTFFVAVDSPVNAFIKKFIAVTHIEDAKQASVGFTWANTAGNFRTKVATKEEVEKSLGFAVPWSNELDAMIGEKKIMITKEKNKPLGYDYEILTDDKLIQVMARYKIGTQPEFEARTTSNPVVKDVDIQGLSAKMFIIPEYKNVYYFYIEKGDWKIVLNIMARGKNKTPVTEQEIISLAQSFKFNK